MRPKPLMPMRTRVSRGRGREGGREGLKIEGNKGWMGGYDGGGKCGMTRTMTKKHVGGGGREGVGRRHGMARDLPAIVDEEGWRCLKSEERSVLLYIWCVCL